MLKIYKDIFKELALVGAFILVSVYLFFKWLSWSTTVFIITNERVIDINRKGIFNKVVTQVEFRNIQEVLYEINGIIATLFRIGNVLIKTLEGTVAMHGVYRPEQIYKTIIEIKNKK